MNERPKTRERILLAAHALFNAEGYGALSAVDIASALSISPGHLYYHFRGKAEIAAELLDRHEEELAMALNAAVAACRPGAGADRAVFDRNLRMLVEELHDARFFYREALAGSPGGAPFAARYRRIATAVRAGVAVMLHGQLGAEAIVEPLAAHIAFGAAFMALGLEAEGAPGSSRALAAEAARRLSALVPAR